MPDAVWVRSHFGDRFVLVDGTEVLDMHTEAEARRFLEELGGEALDDVDPRALPPGLRSDFEAASNREDKLAVLAQMISSREFTVVRLERPFGRLEPVKSVRLSDLRKRQVEEPPPSPVVRPTWIEVRVLGRREVAFPGAPVRVRLPDGSVRVEQLDSDSRWRANDVPERGTCHFELIERPVGRAPRSFEPLSDDLPVLRAGETPVPLVTGRTHTVIVEEPRAACVRLVGMMFVLNKAFLLPEALEGIRLLRHMYDKFPEAEILVVGHTDTTGMARRNLSLSLERAKAVVAYLKDDVDAWLRFYGKETDFSRRWGAPEDLAMLAALPRGGAAYYGEHHEEHTLEAAIRRFQADHDLRDTGELDGTTRRALVTDYMAADETSLPPETSIVAHGCGQHFLAVETDDEVAEPENRRVEVFFFLDGIEPPPREATSDPGSSHYPAWREAIEEERTFKPSEQGLGTLLVVTDIPEALANATSPVFRLAASDGSVDVTLTPSDGAVDRGSVVLEFRELPRGAFYTLTVIEVSGTSTTLFEDVPFPELAGVSSSLDPYIIDPFEVDT